jgi:hypothetical protein
MSARWVCCKNGVSNQKQDFFWSHTAYTTSNISVDSCPRVAAELSGGLVSEDRATNLYSCDTGGVSIKNENSSTLIWALYSIEDHSIYVADANEKKKKKTNRERYRGYC